ncbi:hypothetical protein C8Q69DRAFT_292075 [Paecilomyces variotii]|uniref:Secreted protein n=1 Tax=Byssochlamys spectabilis TaxID=264951 RepID=A0A443HRN8_BYSSP|nr:hypothetical protein C8Q69DRAFT_292075 [Paecilomyces variotii]RWQ94429.1 hypothetical protein C8Q69DRAFT_292075 [Paecilomyces variotii]
MSSWSRLSCLSCLSPVPAHTVWLHVSWYYSPRIRQTASQRVNTPETLDTVAALPTMRWRWAETLSTGTQGNREQHGRENGRNDSRRNSLKPVRCQWKADGDENHSA